MDVSSTNPQNENYDKFLTEKGCICPVCFDPYKIEGNNKTPTRLSGCQHDLCIDCFRLMKNYLCPECRKPFQATSNPVKDITKIAHIETVNQLWKLQFQKKQQAAFQPQAIVTAPIAPKQKTRVLCWNIAAPDIESITDKLNNSFKPIAKTMGWDFNALRNEYLASRNQWVFLQDENTDSIKAIACLLLKSQGRYEIHWSGINGEVCGSEDCYWELYSVLMDEVRVRTYNQYERHKCSASFYFRYKDEWEQFERHLKFIMRNGLRFDAESNVERENVKVTIYPWHFVKETPDVNDNINISLQSIDKIQKDFESIKVSILNKIGLKNLFKTTCIGEQNPAEKALRLTQDFLKNSKDFFIYTIAGKAMGYIQVKSNDHDALEIIHFQMPLQTQNFRKHFVCEFLKWLKENRQQWRGDKLTVKMNWQEQSSLPQDLIEMAKYQKLNYTQNLVEDNWVTTIEFMR